MRSSEEPWITVERQLQAYNTRNLSTYISLFSDDATIWDLGATAPTLVGKAQIEARYKQLFDMSPELHSEVIGRMVFGRAVVDRERITGREGSREPIEMLAIYEVTDGLIRRVHFVR
jgi:hypothetical protein